MESTDGGMKRWGGVAGLADVGDHFFFSQLALKVILILKPEFFSNINLHIKPVAAFNLSINFPHKHRAKTVATCVCVCVCVCACVNKCGRWIGWHT